MVGLFHTPCVGIPLNFGRQGLYAGPCAVDGGIVDAMSGRPASPLRLPKRVRVSMAKLAGSRTAPHAIVVRSRIVLDAAAGLSNVDNARRNDVTVTTVFKWRARVEESPKVSALADASRSGRPARIPVEARALLVQIACERPVPERSPERAKVRVAEAREGERCATKAKRVAAQAVRLAKETARAAHRSAAMASTDVASARRAAQRHQMAAARAGHQFVLAVGREKKARDRRVAEEANAARVGHCPAPFSAVWTYTELQKTFEHRTGYRMSLSEVGRTLRCGGLRPHRVRIWLHSPDPEFRPKVARICALYLQAPPGATVLCIDEKPGMVAREDLNAPHHDRSSGVTRREFEYVRHDTSTLIAAFDVRSGNVFGRCRARTAAGLNEFLGEIAIEYPTGDVYVVWDNLNIHSGPAIESFVKRHGGRFHFVYTPLHASWVNQVEIWFGILQRRVLRHGSFTSTRELDAAVLAFIDHWNMHEAHPFRWRFRGDFEARRLRWAA